MGPKRSQADDLAAQPAARRRRTRSLPPLSPLLMLDDHHRPVTQNLNDNGYHTLTTERFQAPIKLSPAPATRTPGGRRRPTPATTLRKRKATTVADTPRKKQKGARSAAAKKPEAPPIVRGEITQSRPPVHSQRNHSIPRQQETTQWQPHPASTGYRSPSATPSSPNEEDRPYLPWPDHGRASGRSGFSAKNSSSAKEDDGSQSGRCHDETGGDIWKATSPWGLFHRGRSSQEQRSSRAEGGTEDRESKNQGSPRSNFHPSSSAQNHSPPSGHTHASPQPPPPPPPPSHDANDGEKQDCSIPGPAVDPTVAAVSDPAFARDESEGRQKRSWAPSPSPPSQSQQQYPPNSAVIESAAGIAAVSENLEGFQALEEPEPSRRSEPVIPIGIETKDEETREQNRRGDLNLSIPLPTSADDRKQSEPLTGKTLFWYSPPLPESNTQPAPQKAQEPGAMAQQEITSPRLGDQPADGEASRSSRCPASPAQALSSSAPETATGRPLPLSLATRSSLSVQASPPETIIPSYALANSPVSPFGTTSHPADTLVQTAASALVEISQSPTRETFSSSEVQWEAKTKERVAPETECLSTEEASSPIKTESARALNAGTEPEISSQLGKVPGATEPWRDIKSESESEPKPRFEKVSGAGDKPSPESKSTLEHEPQPRTSPPTPPMMATQNPAPIGLAAAGSPDELEEGEIKDEDLLGGDPNWLEDGPNAEVAPMQDPPQAQAREQEIVPPEAQTQAQSPITSHSPYSPAPGTANGAKTSSYAAYPIEAPSEVPYPSPADTATEATQPQHDEAEGAEYDPTAPLIPGFVPSAVAAPPPPAADQDLPASPSALELPSPSIPSGSSTPVSLFGINPSAAPVPANAAPSASAGHVAAPPPSVGVVALDQETGISPPKEEPGATAAAVKEEEEEEEEKEDWALWAGKQEEDEIDWGDDDDDELFGGDGEDFDW